MNLKSSFNQHLLQKYPLLTAEQLNLHVSEQLISPFQVQLDSSIIQQMKNEIKGYWRLRSWSEKQLSEKYDTLHLRKPSNYSACMSYDFHLSAEKKLELIEINTNAAFLALGLELYSFWKIAGVDPAFSTKSLVDMFQNEIMLTKKSVAEPSVAIFDEKPEEQRLYVEFLLFKSLFDKFKIKSAIIDLADSAQLKEFSLVYNRYTDFYLQNKTSASIKEMFNSNQIELSPHPWEYFLLADKQRLIDWNRQDEVEKPKSLLPVFDLATSVRADIWAKRKNLFFKPKTSFGGKQAYRGTSISTKAFDSIYHDDFIAQKISIAPEIEVNYLGNVVKFKYDLRCYAYQDQLQLVVARLYQGQTTNLNTPGGGFACVVFN